MTARRSLMTFAPSLHVVTTNPCARLSTSPRKSKSARASPRMSLPTDDMLRSASFMASVDHAATILRAFPHAASSATPHLSLLRTMLGTSNGARGLLVSLLSDASIALFPPPPPAALLDVLAHDGDRPVVRDLLVKNVVMSSCMVVYYARKGGGGGGGDGSALTKARAVQVLRGCAHRDPGLVDVADDMRDGLAGSGAVCGRFAGFVRKWGYDDEQMKAARAALGDAMRGVQGWRH